MKIVVGLGNPGTEYRGTRHNVGFAVVDRFAEIQHLEWGATRFESAWASGRVGGRTVAIMKPQTYMNLSGRAVHQAVSFYKITAEAVLVVCDDFHIPLGTLRFRRRGSSGGQKGLDSILTEFATEDVPRLRFGVGPLPEGRDASDFVLSRFTAAERETARQTVETAADRVRDWAGGKDA